MQQERANILGERVCNEYIRRKQMCLLELKRLLASKQETNKQEATARAWSKSCKNGYRKI
jgi:hypothetical protein